MSHSFPASDYIHVCACVQSPIAFLPVANLCAPHTLGRHNTYTILLTHILSHTHTLSLSLSHTHTQLQCLRPLPQVASTPSLRREVPCTLSRGRKKTPPLLSEKVCPWVLKQATTLYLHLLCIYAYLFRVLPTLVGFGNYQPPLTPKLPPLKPIYQY